jgi:hypothetical protein
MRRSDAIVILTAMANFCRRPPNARPDPFRQPEDFVVRAFVQAFRIHAAMSHKCAGDVIVACAPYRPHLPSPISLRHLAAAALSWPFGRGAPSLVRLAARRPLLAVWPRGALSWTFSGKALPLCHLAAGALCWLFGGGALPLGHLAAGALCWLFGGGALPLGHLAPGALCL